MHMCVYERDIYISGCRDTRLGIDMCGGQYMVGMYRHMGVVRNIHEE